MRSAIARTSYSLWLMKTMLWPSDGQPAEDLEDLVGLLRGQHGGGLVEDEDPRVPIERLEDLDALLPADRQRTDLGLGVHLEPETAAELDDTLVGLLAIEEERPGHRLVAEHDVLGDGQHRHQHEMLVDHADATLDGIRRAGQVDLGPIEKDLPLVRSCETVEDVHECRLAGAVLAEQRVDLTWPHFQVDGVVGDDARIALRDAEHLERRCANCLGLRRHRCLACRSTTPICDGRAPKGGPPILRPGQSPMGGAGVFPHASAGQVTSVPAAIPARAVSILACISAGSLLAAS